MGLFDKVKDLVAGNKDKAKEGIDKAADMADEKTEGKYSDQIDTGAEKGKEIVDGLDTND